MWRKRAVGLSELRVTETESEVRGQSTEDACRHGVTGHCRLLCRVSGVGTCGVPCGGAWGECEWGLGR